MLYVEKKVSKKGNEYVGLFLDKDGVTYCLSINRATIMCILNMTFKDFDSIKSGNRIEIK